jgi:DNA-binding transcriptional LysR family regulator
VDLDLRDLRYFQTIAEVGHLGRAAELLGRSQPALTKCVRRLEALLGATLFDHKGRGIQLTPVGEMLLLQTRRLRNAADSCLREVQDFESGETGRVRIGCGALTVEYLVPGICDLVLEQAPGLKLEISVGMNVALRERLRRGELDVVVGLVREGEEEFAAQPLMDDIVVVAAGRSHPIFREGAVRLADLLGYGWVLPMAEVASRQWLDRAFEAQGLPRPRPQIEVNSIPMLVQTIARTDLLCFTSRSTLSGRLATPLREVELEATTLRRRLGLIYADVHVAPAVQRLMDLLSANPGRLGG